MRLGLLALWGLLFSAPGLAADPAPACGRLASGPDAVQVAWISPTAKRVGGGADMEVVRVQHLRAVLPGPVHAGGLARAEADARYCPQCLRTDRDVLARWPSVGCGSAVPADGWGELLEVGAVLDRHYRVLRHLAVGGGGMTYRGRELDA